MSPLQQPIAWPAITGAVSVQKYFTPVDLGVNGVTIPPLGNVQSPQINVEGYLHASLYFRETGGTDPLSVLQVTVQRWNENDEIGVFGDLGVGIIINGGTPAATGVWAVRTFSFARDDSSGGPGVVRTCSLNFNNLDDIASLTGLTARLFLRAAPFALPQRGAP